MTAPSSSLKEFSEVFFGKPLPLLQEIFAEETTPVKKAILLAGPTGVGKTEFSLKLAEVLGGEVISADSVQAYIGADIGTAKVSQEDQKRIPHHLIDIREVQDQMNVFEFYHAAYQIIKEIIARNRVPIIVGGAGFYFKTLMEGPPQGPPADENLRKQLEGELDRLGIESLYERLQEIDPDYANTITHRDKQKIVRGLEIIALTKKKVSSFKKGPSLEQPFPVQFHSWFLYRPRDHLYERVERRCDEMLAQGLLEETERLMKEGAERNRSLAMAIGYRQAIAFLRGSQSEEDYKRFVLEFKKVSRQYIKRQFTWFRRETQFRWLNLDFFSLEKAIEVVGEDYLLRGS